MNFKGKTALITGAAVGIGRAVAHKFAQNGFGRIINIASVAEKNNKLRSAILNVNYFVFL